MQIKTAVGRTPFTEFLLK